MFKKVLSVLFVLFILFCTTVNCYAAVDIDGNLTNAEWRNRDIYYFETPESFNNSVKEAYLKAFADFSQNKIYLCVMMKLDSFQDYNLTGLKFSFDNKDEILIKGTGEGNYNADLYEVIYELDYDSVSKSVFYELSVGFKSGVKNKSILSIALIDTYSHPSNWFKFNLDFDEVATTENRINNKATEQFTKSTRQDKAEKSKTSRTSTTDDFTFKRVEGNAVENNSQITQTTNSTTVLTLSNNVIDNKSRKEKIYIATGVLGMFSVIVACVYRNIKNNKQADKE